MRDEISTIFWLFFFSLRFWLKNFLSDFSKENTTKWHWTWLCRWLFIKVLLWSLLCKKLELKWKFHRNKLTKTCQKYWFSSTQFNLARLSLTQLNSAWLCLTLFLRIRLFTWSTPKLSHDKGHHMWFEITLSLGIWAVYIAKRQNGSWILLFLCFWKCKVKSNIWRTLLLW